MKKFEESYVAMILIKKRQVYVMHFSGVQMEAFTFLCETKDPEARLYKLQEICKNKMK